MKHYQYLIVGGGMAADAAVEGIRELDPKGSIGMISAELDPPYKRPLLSKGLWKGKPIEKVWLNTPSRDVDLMLDCRVQSLDAARYELTTEDGAAYRFDKLLLATGGRPKRLPFGGDSVLYFRTLRDYRRLRELAGEKERIAVIGGGFIGSEIAAALAMNGHRVSLIVRDDTINGSLFPAQTGEFLNELYRRKGVDLLTDQQVRGIEPRNGHQVLELSEPDHHGYELHADAVVAGIGLAPNIELASEAGLYTNDGIWVDEFLQASATGIYAAGDVASFHNPALGIRRRMEHEDNALRMGYQAGRNMAGAREPYHHLPYFYSDLFDVGYEAVGDLRPEYDKTVEWKRPYEEGIIYYSRDSRVRGLLFWNIFGQVEEGRRLIAEGRTVQELAGLVV